MCNITRFYTNSNVAQQKMAGDRKKKVNSA